MRPMTKLEIIQNLPSAGHSEAITLASLNEATDRLQKTVEDLALAIRPIARAMDQLAPTIQAMAKHIEQIERRQKMLEARLQSEKQPEKSTGFLSRLANAGG